uniref:Arginine decarboxylase n=1 Tax=Magnetococcus massalia (strain MO-1) TaxID=451514 RepID=A0A1S7LMS6_MAGMO|nr:biosynthetic arginine decarboxylase, PLP-binding [Candidatus Magnetococcus massalia]
MHQLSPPHAKPAWSIENAATLYNLPEWGLGYFAIDPQGQLIVQPTGEAQPNSCALAAVVDEVSAKGLSGPLLLRFPAILHDRIERLNRAFDESRARWGYGGRYQGVYPIKVNQDRAVVEEIVSVSSSPAGSERSSMGLEVGSKPELAIAMAYMDRAAMVICNGYKDADYIELALRATGMGFPIYLVVDRLDEVAMITRLSQELGITPKLGLRARLLTQGVGLWAESAGGFSKFGLTAGEMLSAIEQLESAGMLQCLTLLHMHQGSQLTDLAVVEESVQETARFYVELRRMRCPLEYVDIGGGLGVDYEGLRSNEPCSTNYSLGQYADVVLGALAEACRPAGEPEPHLITESGRALTAPHTVLVVDVAGWSRLRGGGWVPQSREEDAPEVQMLTTLAEDFDPQRAAATWQQALSLSQAVQHGFIGGRMDIHARAEAERAMLYLARLVHQAMGPFPDQQLDQLQDYVTDRYLVNFSIFQSLPDVWAVNQLFPIMPIERLDEEPEAMAILQDLTCDSDGQIKQFIGCKEPRGALPVHHPRGDESYRLGFFLVGAYQEILGDLHNLFGDTHIVEVGFDKGGAISAEEIRLGQTNLDVLRMLAYEEGQLLEQVEAIMQKGAEQPPEPAQSAAFQALFHSVIHGYSYLKLAGE